MLFLIRIVASFISPFFLPICERVCVCEKSIKCPHVRVCARLFLFVQQPATAAAATKTTSNTLKWNTNIFVYNFQAR